MSDILNKDIKVLKLNQNWWAIGFEPIDRAFSEMCSMGKSGRAPRLGVDIEYAQREDGSYDLSAPLSYRPVSVEEWFRLPVRSCDLSINCNHRLIRVPTVTVCSNYRDIPDKAPKFSADAIRAREGGRCAATGRLLAPGEGDLGHDIAKSKGGRRTYTNVAYVDKQINRAMHTKTFAEAGYPHVKAKMVAPKRTKVLITSKDVYHESQLHFVN
jgi:5-methylcytosine-specific restriction endonuclease McrA